MLKALEIDQVNVGPIIEKLKTEILNPDLLKVGIVETSSK
jgi:hypothetical protein